MHLAWPGVLFEQHGLLGLAKPAGLHVFGRPSLCEWLLSLRPELARIGPAAEAAIVHRLDRDTSGLVLAATDAECYQRLRRAFGEGRLIKDYLALVEGRLEAPRVIEAALGGRYRRSRRVQVADGTRRLRGVRPARSEIDSLGVGNEVSLCRVRIRSGMRHQVRAHLAHAGHPLVGDGLYGARLAPDATGGLAFGLHAWAAQIPADVAGEAIHWVCPLPTGLLEWLDRLGLSAP